VGRVSAADTGRPLKGARVTLGGSQIAGGRSAVTDDSGVFDFQQLPEGRYNLNASKAGFVSLAYGQRRPMQPGTPLQLSTNQTLRDLELRLPRGSAITGRVTDELGEPMPSIMVRAMRQQFVQGQRQLVAAGAAQTDDRGQYRVWGLNPGEYYISAVAPNFVLPDFLGRGGRGGGQNGPGGPGGRGGLEGRGAGRANIGAFVEAFSVDVDLTQLSNALAQVGNITLLGGLDGSATQVSYAPTYYPGVSSTREAQPVTVALAAEATGIDFSLLLVQMARVSGRVTSQDGGAVTSGNINLSSNDEPGDRGGPLSGNYGTRIQGDGTFTIANVPPGQYMLRARSNVGPGGRGERGGRGAAAAGANGRGGGGGNARGGIDPNAPPRFASQPVFVSGDLTDLSVVLAPGAEISGTITVQAVQTSPIDLSQVRIMARPADQAIGQETTGRADRSGTFSIAGIPAGPHWFRVQAPRGLTLKAVLINGRDVIDAPHDIRPGERLAGATIVLTDRVSEISGTITDDRSTPIPDYTVLAFSEDPEHWGPQSRHIMTTRPDQNGKFQIRGLPPGRYYLVAIDPTIQGEWFDPAFLEQHRDGAGRLTLAEGEVKTQDFRVATK
jgi:protocatechuate 3,4-dioxygenase beta subunit